ncbi:hypothetical protein [Marinitoga lauensis]|uniref:hypothetical protein n=1 Tax=Marinitoga lauensis TaxID=2201189 RepID=UPI00197F44E4|nr:hypothetical protein [Marinitoga lauensis]
MALANELTKEKVKINEELFQRKAILSAMGIDFKTDKEAYELFNKKYLLKNKRYRCI